MLLCIPSEKCLRTVYFAAVLLTGSAEEAEAAVLEAIASLNDVQDMTADERLLQLGIAAALKPHHQLRLLNRNDFGTVSLPVELQNVCRLPRALRTSFVLRVLLRMPLHRCVTLLGIEKFQLDENVAAAILLLTLDRGKLPLCSSSTLASENVNEDRERTGNDRRLQ